MYAECNHEIVDLLLGFLTYPVGCLIKNMIDDEVTSHLWQQQVRQYVFFFSKGDT
jgi:hypothetical protein